MADVSPNDAAGTGLIRFEIIPREALRASLAIFRAMVVQPGYWELTEMDNFQDYAKEVLNDAQYSWPLTVKTGSRLATRVDEVLSVAKATLHKI